MKTRFLSASLLAAATLLVTGCSGLYFASPTSGRSRLEQVLLSATLDDAVLAMTQSGLDPLIGKKVYVEVGDLDAEDLTSDYVQMTVSHRLSAMGVVPVYQPEDADAILLVRVRTAGVDRSRDPLPFSIGAFMTALVRYNRVWAAAELDATAVSTDTSSILLTSRPGGMATNYYKEWGFLPILFFEPFALTARSSSLESPLLGSLDGPTPTGGF